MDPYQLIASLLWAGFGMSLIALLAGVVLANNSRRLPALAVLLIAELGTLSFSLIAGFSVGRFTVVLPVLVSGYVLGMGRGHRTVGSCVLGAALAYLLFSWLLTPLVLNGGVLAILFGFWAMPLYVAIAVISFASAFAKKRVPTGSV